MNKKLSRSKGPNAMFLGVCAGLGKYLDFDPTIIRIAVALITFFSWGTLALVYIIMAFILPVEE
jgi:phage shock protein C